MLKEERDHPLKYSVHSRLRKHHLRKSLPFIKEGRMLDIGCGLGYMIQALGKGYTCYGMDNNISVLKGCKMYCDNTLINASAFNLPFVSNCFEVIICSEVMEHLPNDMDQKALQEMARVLKKDGIIMVTVPALEGIRSTSHLRNLGHDVPGNSEYHYKIGYTKDVFQGLISKIPEINIEKHKYSMFIISEIFMDLLKWVFHKKNSFEEHSDIMKADESFIFRVYKTIFPLLNVIFLIEDFILKPFLKGHIHIYILKKNSTSNKNE